LKDGLREKVILATKCGFVSNPKKSEETGVSVSTIQANGQLTSAWTYLDKTSIAYTTCNKKSN
jgi:aryl-alcohol dehydrogenase-like predicted oxidoreductase